jgi:crotonobetainyl-CoA:carnitine CoA-transferase CaiB-like acyl-CoA transferase
MGVGRAAKAGNEAGDVAPAAGALSGWRVLEFADGVAASFCAKVVADLGADVVKVEPSGGHPSRRWGPRRPDAPPDEPSGRFLYLNTSKGSVVVGDGAAGERLLRDLAAACDVIVTDRSATEIKSLGALDEATTVVAITPFGAAGPYAGYRAHHLVTFHSGCEGSILPSGLGFNLFPERPPIQIGGDIADYDAGWNAAVALLAACHDRLRTGRGQRVDVSAQESQLTLNRTRLSRFNNDGVTLHREGSRYGFLGMVACCDGWVQLVGVTPDQWDRLAASPEAGELADPRFATAAARAEDLPAAAEALLGWCKARGKADVVRILAAVGCPVGAYATPAELLSSPQFQHRGFFRGVEDGRGGTLLLPGPPYLFSATPVAMRAAPAPGSSMGFGPEPTVKPIGAAGRGLEGVRILDFTWAAAGPYGTCLLALLGAEVIKVESTKRPDPARRGFLTDYGGINRSPNFNEINLNKRSFQVDLSRPKGLALARRLATEWAEVVVDNFRPGVMTRFGLDAATLLAERPDLVVVSSSANGASGPEAMAAGLASIFGATGGLSEQTGYPDGPPCEVGESTDYRSANALAVAVLAALLHRARTGEGQHIDLASREVVAASSPDALVAHQLRVPWDLRVGNAHREMAPHGVYPTAGEDNWVAVAIGSDAEWTALCFVLGRKEWTSEHPTAATRRAARAEIDDAVGGWARQRSSRQAYETLQAAGVPAMAVMTNEALATDPHLAARNVFLELVHPEMGPTRVMRAPWLFSDLTCELRPGPLIGQDNDHVLTGILGLSDGERAQIMEVLT